MLAVLPCKIHAQTALETAWQTLVNDEGLRSALVVACVVDGNSGEEIFARNADLAVVPASAVKVVVTRVALELLGADFRFETRLEAHGTVDHANFVLNGNLVVVASGDPSLGSQHIQSSEFIADWVNAVRKANIRRIAGDLVVDEAIYSGSPIAGSTSVEDAGNYYGAGAHALNAWDNEFVVTLKGNRSTGVEVSVEGTRPELPWLNITSQVQTSSLRADLAYVHGRPYDRSPIVYGTIPSGASTFEIRAADPDPAYHLLHRLREALLKEGIAVDGSLKVVRNQTTNTLNAQLPVKQLAVVRSPLLTDLVKHTNLKSINLYAGAMFRALARAESGQHGSALERVHAYFEAQGWDVSGLYLTDGSGLSRMNTATARQLALACSRLEGRADGALDAGLKPFAGIPGVRVKSGYMARVRAYCGRVTLADGSMRSFAVVINNHGCSPTHARQCIEAFTRHIPKP